MILLKYFYKSFHDVEHRFSISASFLFLFLVYDICDWTKTCDTLQITGTKASVLGTYHKTGVVYERPVYARDTDAMYLTYCGFPQFVWKLKVQPTYCGGGGHGFTVPSGTWCDPTEPLSGLDGWNDNIIITCVP